jgi:hypothetical protein
VLARRLRQLLGLLRRLRQLLGGLLARRRAGGRRLAAARRRVDRAVEAGVAAVAVRGAGRRRHVVADDRHLAALGVDPVDDGLRTGVGELVGPSPTTARCPVSGFRAVLGEQLSDRSLSRLWSAFVTH